MVTKINIVLDTTTFRMPSQGVEETFYESQPKMKTKEWYYWKLPNLAQLLTNCDRMN